MKKYKLLQKLPWANEGSIVHLHEEGHSFHEMFYRKYSKDPLWFEPVGERWKPENGEDYWWIDDYGDTRQWRWDNEGIEQKMWAVGNCFQTKDQAVEAIKRRKQTLQQFHKEIARGWK